MHDVAGGACFATAGFDHDRSIAGAQCRDRGPGSSGGAAGAWAGGCRPRPAGPAGQIATALSRRLNRGESLPEALEGEAQSIPPLYRAVVEAGARSGQLPIALEGLAKYVRGYSEARAAIGLALWYPLLVLALAYALFVGLVVAGGPWFIETFESLGLGVAAPLRGLSWIGRSVPYWWPVGPILLCRALDRLGEVRHGGAVSGGVVELAHGSSPG